jgi:hypothetical protein
MHDKFIEFMLRCLEKVLYFYKCEEKDIKVIKNIFYGEH